MKQICQIVDENDELIGHKFRNEIDYKNDYYRIGCLWLINSKGQVLLAQRKLSRDKDPGKWGPSAAGTLEKGETYETNVYKEADEEIGLVDVGFSLIAKIKLEKPRKAFMQLYTGTCDWPADKFTPQPEEVEQVTWIDIEKLKKDMSTNPDKYVPGLWKIVEAISY